MTDFVNLSDINGQNTDLGSGFDAMVMQDPRGAYDLDVNPDGNGVAAITHATDGTSASVSGAEYLVFADGQQTVPGVYDDILFLLTPEEAQVARVYNTAFGRKPDIAGLEYWIEQKNAGMDIFEIAARFMDSDEFVSAYGDLESMSNADVVNNLYSNVLGRGPDLAGFEFWKGELDSGARSRTKVFVDMTESPENKESVANWLIDEGVDSLGQSSPQEDLRKAGMDEGRLDMSQLDTSDLSQYEDDVISGLFMETLSDNSAIDYTATITYGFPAADQIDEISLADDQGRGYASYVRGGITINDSNGANVFNILSDLATEDATINLLSDGVLDVVDLEISPAAHTVITGFEAGGPDVLISRVVGQYFNTESGEFQTDPDGVYVDTSVGGSPETGDTFVISGYSGDGSKESVAATMDGVMNAGALDSAAIAALQVGSDVHLYRFAEQDEWQWGAGDANGNGAVDAEEIGLIAVLTDTDLASHSNLTFGARASPLR